MITGMYLSKCGNCGHDKFQVYSPHTHRTPWLTLECVECQATTEIGIQPAELKVSFAKDSKGMIYFDKESIK